MCRISSNKCPCGYSLNKLSNPAGNEGVAVIRDEAFNMSTTTLHNLQSNLVLMYRIYIHVCSNGTYLQTEVQETPSFPLAMWCSRTEVLNWDALFLSFYFFHWPTNINYYSVSCDIHRPHTQ